MSIQPGSQRVHHDHGEKTYGAADTGREDGRLGQCCLPPIDGRMNEYEHQEQGLPQELTTGALSTTTEEDFPTKIEIYTREWWNGPVDAQRPH